MNRIAAVLFLCTVVSGCRPAGAKFAQTASYTPRPKSPAAVEILLGEKPERAHKNVGLIESTAGHHDHYIQPSLDAMRRTAADKGVDGVHSVSCFARKYTGCEGTAFVYTDR
jgi:hypothetical protein